MTKTCEICGKILGTRKILNFSMPSYEGHESCLIAIRENERIEEKSKFLEAQKKERLQTLETGFLGASINWKLRTFDTWVKNDENKPVVEFLKEWDINTRGMILSGATGVGKTHLLSALATHLALDKGLSFRFIRFSAWADKIRSVNFELAEEMILEMQNATILFLDDIGTGTITDHIESKFCRILDHRLEFNLSTFISTNLSDKDFKTSFSPRIISRLLGLCEWIELINLTKDWRANG